MTVGRRVDRWHIDDIGKCGKRCTAEIRAGYERSAVNDYAGSGLDERWEDAGAEICGR